MGIDLLTIAIPIFILTMLVEIVVDLVKKSGYYRLHDSMANLGCGIISQVIGLLKKAFILVPFTYIANNLAIFDWSSNIWVAWVLGIVGYDFCYYWYHRKSHEMNFMWASHIVHHQSEEYNLAVALRQASFSFFNWIFYLPLAFLGVPVEIFITSGAISLIYQFFIHTRFINKLHPWIEYIWNTPSHHRVHHGKNPKYIDSNYAAIWMFWDRMFGTFVPEEEEPIYGITDQFQSFNPIYANVSHWEYMIKTAILTNSWKNKFLIFWKGPAFWPDDLPEKEKIDINGPKFATIVATKMNLYMMFQFIALVAATTYLLFFYNSMSEVARIVTFVFVFASTLGIAYLSENRKSGLVFEVIKFGVLPFIFMY